MTPAGFRRGRFVALALIASSALAFGRTPASAEPPEVDSCIGRLDPQLDIGYDRIAVRCPELLRKLEQGPWAPWLPRGWNEPGNDLSAGGIKELRRLIIMENSADFSGPVPDVARLPAALNGLTGKSADGIWPRFKNWLRSILERREEPTDESWFSRLTSHIGVAQSIRQIIAYVALAVVVLLAGAIIGNELRAAGLMPDRSGPRRRPIRPVQGSSGRGPVDLRGAPALERPRLLLELLLPKLSERGILPPPGALTVRELTASARLPELADRERLSCLALAAERVRYSGGEIGPAELEAPVSGGRELLTRLQAGSL
jgi:hypothetical protein